MTKHPELITMRDYIRFATTAFNEAGLFYGHGTDNAFDEALALVLHTLHLPHDINPAMLDAHLIKDEQHKLSTLISERIEKRIPLPYLTHEAWFAGLPFYVDERVLIPRSSIAELIEERFEPWINANEVQNILDLCTGSGCIAIACAFAFPEANIDASDLSKDALAVAKINLLKHHLEDQVTLLQSDLFTDLSQKQYDIIVTNPPYVDQADMESLPKEYLHEPRLGLAAGTSGLDVILKILAQAGEFLTENGILVAEVGNSEIALAEQYPNVPFTWLSFKHGDGGVFVLTKEELKAAQAMFVSE